MRTTLLITRYLLATALAWGLGKKERAAGKVNKPEAGEKKKTLKKRVRGQKIGREGERPDSG